MKFNYQARTKEGKVKAGIVEASSKEGALILLQKYGLYVTFLEESQKPIYARELKFLKKASFRDLVLFSRQLSIMVSSKITLTESLKTIANQTENLDLREKVFNLSEQIEGGRSFSQAASAFPQLFSKFYIAMVKAGEASGKLAESLNYLADHLEREYELTSKLKGASVYPTLIIVFIFIVFNIMIFTVIPNLKMVLAETEAQTPPLTAAIMAFTEFLQKYAIFVFGAIAAALVGLFRYYKTEEGKRLFDKFFLKVPLFGALLKKVYLARLAENLSTLISAGIMINQALEITSEIVGNNTYQEAMFSISQDVRDGVPLSSAVSLFPENFPPIFVQMISVGEKTGTLDSSLIYVSDFYRKESDRAIDSMLSILEPLLIIFLGGIVGGLMLAVLLPIYQTVTL